MNHGPAALPQRATPQPGHDLSALCAGLNDPARDSQALFRCVLQAYSHPGRLVSIPMIAANHAPNTAASAAHWPLLDGCGAQASSAALLLALLDAETTLWLSPTLAQAEGLASWLRFHTGCRVLAQPQQAQFVWAAQLDELPDLADLACGSDASPETAATCLIDVPVLCTGPAAADWVLSGPGIADRAWLGLPGASAHERDRFLALRLAGQALFPRGPDWLLASAQQIVGLPRSTQLQPWRTHPEPAAEH
jgi:alpha-D-ribose 1-methylphosphonate 5-triphosphate synthase subunit PhnH